MNILVTNDDGVHAPGLWALARELSEVGRLLIVAPDREQSGVGTSVTLHRPLRVKEVRPHLDKVRTFAVEGTPGDCVILGLQALNEGSIDLVVAGVNEGSNLGNDVLISGTVGAALQAHFSSIPAIAVSVAELKDPIFGPAARMAGILARKVASRELTPDIFLNVNLPNRPLDEIKGLAITQLAQRTYVDTVEQRTDTRGKRYYWIVRGKPVWDVAEGTDIWALREGLVSITPLHSNVASVSQFERLRQLSPELYSSFAQQSVP